MLQHIDSGHRWLEVKREELYRLGIADRISPYSYEFHDKVYLEEDCDMAIFLEALYGVTEWWEVPELLESYRAIPFVRYVGDNDAPCRNYPCFRGGKLSALKTV